MTTDRPLLTPVEVAERLRVKPRTVYDMLARGGPMAHLRIELGPKTIRVHPDALDAYLQQGAAADAAS